MPVNDDMLQAIQNALGQAIVPSLTTEAAASDLFEAFVLGILLEAATVEGATIQYFDVAGNATTQFVFRTGPGYIFSTSQPYTHALISFEGCPSVEAHVGVRVAGSSEVLHECDIAVIHQDKAELCRSNNVHPRRSDLLLAVECKFYTSDLKLHLGRSFLGLGVDLGTDNCRFVVNTVSNSIAKLIAKHRPLKWEHSLVPGATLEIDRLRSSFQEVFKNFRARFQ